jgi:predicted ATPase
LHSDEQLARDALAFLFWPDLPETEARSKLRSHLHYITQGLPRQDFPWLLADKRTVRWNAEAPTWIDVKDFEKLANAKEFERAVELYTGDLLSGFEDEWIAAPRARLSERQIELLTGLFEDLRKQGERARAIQYAQQLLALDPWREDVMAAVIAMRTETGDRAGAVQAYREFANRLREELGVEPSSVTQHAYEAVLSGETAGAPAEQVARATMGHNLPSYLTSFVDRIAEMKALQTATLDRRLVTVTGPGGVGKTRLAIEAARQITDRFSGGVWLINLASVTDDRLVASTVAAELGFADRSENGLIEALRDRHALLILDNCEHLRGIPQFAARLAQHCARLHFIATSREPLRITGEWIQRVPSLRVVDAHHASESFEGLFDAPAVRLFLDRAADVSPFHAAGALSSEDCRALATITQRLDGIPLAIELAAARTSALSLKLIAQRLDERFTLLAGASRAAPPRHQTMRATLDWSFDSLTHVEQRVLMRLGAFIGGCDIDALAFVLSDVVESRWQAQDHLASLIDKSLVTTERTERGPRYYLSETTRAYALEKLQQSGEHQGALSLHAQYYAGLSAADPELAFRDGPWFAAMKPDLPNIRAALRWSIELQNDFDLGASLAESLAWFAYSEPLFIEAERWCRASLATIDSPSVPQEAALQLALSKCYTFLLDMEPYFASALRAAELYRELGDDLRLAYALFHLADAYRHANDSARAGPLADEALDIARRLGQPRTLGLALLLKTRVTDVPFETKRAYFEESLNAFRSIDNLYGVRNCLLNLAESAFECGEPENALRYAQQCIDMSDEHAESQQDTLAIVLSNTAAYAVALRRFAEAIDFGRRSLLLTYRANNMRHMAWALQHLACVASERGEYELAARLAGASEERRGHGADYLEFTERFTYEKVMAELQAHLSEPELEGLLHQGRRWNTERAVEEGMRVE